MGKKTKDLREKTDQDLTKLLAETRRKLVGYQTQKTTLKLKNTQKISQIKRDIARLLTFLREREIQASIGKGLKR
jgi:large subunit ribosomal protein L29